jgi:integrase
MTPRLRSENTSKKYPELHKLPWTSNWVFRRYSSEKKKEFVASTGVPAQDKLADQAYRVGRERFDRWVGAEFPAGRMPLFRDLAKVVLASKQGKKANTYRSAKNWIENHLIPAFGHLRCEQVTLLRWNVWVAEQKKRGRITRFYNARKHLLEIIRRAQDEGFVKRVPRYENPDPQTSAGEYVDQETFERLLAAASPDTRLLAEIVYRMGARPGEVIQWRYDMIRWEDGTIDIPGAITKTGRHRTIPLNPAIACLLKTRSEASDSPYVFPSPGRKGQPIKEYKTGWRAACRRAGVDFELYSLRHTFITNCAKRGVSIVFAARYCDTSVAMIDRVYAKATPESLNEVAGVTVRKLSRRGSRRAS